MIPKAFETVIPSERTILSLNVSDCSIQLRTPTHPGSVVGALNNLEFAVDMIGNSPEMSTRLKLVSGWILAIDNLTSAVPYKTSARNRSAQASDYWRVHDLCHLMSNNYLFPSPLSEIGLCAVTRDKGSRCTCEA